MVSFETIALKAFRTLTPPPASSPGLSPVTSAWSRTASAMEEAQKKQVKIVKPTSLLGPNFITSFWAQVQEAFTCLISRLAAVGGRALGVRGCIPGEVPVTEEKPLSAALCGSTR